MSKLKFALVLAIVFQFSCKTLTSPSSVQPEPGPTSNGQEAFTPSTPDDTNDVPESGLPSEPAPIFLPSFGPDYFGRLELLHDYWPVITTAANLGSDAAAAKSVSMWGYSYDGQYLAVAGCDVEAGDSDYFLSVFSVTCEDIPNAHAYLFLLDAKAGNIIATLPPTGQVTTVKSLDFNHDRTKLVYALSSGEVAIWDIDSKSVSVVSQEASPYARASFSPDGLLIAIRGNPLGKIWDVTNQKFVAELKEPEYGFPNFSADGKTLQWQNYPNAATYDTSSWQKISSVSLQYDNDNDNATSIIVGVIDTSPDLTLLAECQVETKNAPVGIWDLTTGQKIQTLEGEWNNCSLLQFTPDGKWLLRFDEDGRQVSIWQVNTWEYFGASSAIQNVVSIDDRYVISLDFSADGKTVLVPTYNRLALYGLP